MKPYLLFIKNSHDPAAFQCSFTCFTVIHTFVSTRAQIGLIFSCRSHAHIPSQTKSNI